MPICTPVGKVVDQVCVHRAEGIYAVLDRLVRTGSLEWPNPRRIASAIARYMAGH
jgi:hypothetical protein